MSMHYVLVCFVGSNRASRLGTVAVRGGMRRHRVPPPPTGWARLTGGLCASGDLKASPCDAAHGRCRLVIIMA